MAVWRHLYFQPGPYKPDTTRSAQWNHGAYLVQGLAHCGACHTPRNRLGAKSTEVPLAGGSVAIDGWIAPNITPNKVLGIGAWPAGGVRDFLATGRGAHRNALGPMRDVVQSSLQYLRGNDLDAMVAYLRTVPSFGPSRPPAGAPTAATVAPAPGAKPKQAPPGEALYRKHCAACHGDGGIAKHDYYPNLRNSSVALAPNPTNLVLIILRGGFQASTKTYPYPYSMPPFGFKLSDQDIADIANYIRGSWSKWPVAAVYPDQVGNLR
jgi:mono/diheme cytochrome c family protein